MAYIEQQRLDGYAERVRYALSRKQAFDRKLESRKPGEVIFAPGKMVQVHRSNLDVLSAHKKLVYSWGAPYRVKTRVLNSYILETVDGVERRGLVHARRLKRFAPKIGSGLEAVHHAFLAARVLVGIGTTPGEGGAHVLGVSESNRVAVLLDH
ncbi:unnamed protein product [Mycena citricolor]|uniref:Uncharacterized protein n=1 Tax=Mycena citricolor TaxID=2018698 RepID=A0AAD2K2V5_9AGAR|nr:unnamed protein product [Mycena citricolor]